jgi:signal transduction histidine kinase
MQKLRREKNNLLEAANVLKGRYFNENKMLAEQISAIFFKEIEKIDISSAKSAIKSLRMLVDDFVKPLSHDLMEKIPKWNSENFESITDRVTFRDVISSINPENSINIKILTTLMALQILPFISIYGAPKSFEIIGVICVIFPAALKLAKIILLKLTKEISVAIRLVLIVIILGISTLPTCSVVFLIIRQSKDPYYFFKAGPSFTILASGLLVLVKSIQAASEKVRSELNEINDQLRWIIARINLVNWNVQGNFSRIMHGKIQSILHIAIYNLNKSIEDEVSHNLILQNVKAEIQDTLLNTMASISNNTSIESTLIQFQENWDGIINIVLEANSKDLATINLDHAAMNALLSIVQESISNAIQHANSTSIKIRINLWESQIILEIENDGKEFKEFNFGNGMTELALISISYQINHYENKTLIKTNLPFVSQ